MTPTNQILNMPERYDIPSLSWNDNQTETHVPEQLLRAPKPSGTIHDIDEIVFPGIIMNGDRRESMLETLSITNPQYI